MGEVRAIKAPRWWAWTKRGRNVDIKDMPLRKIEGGLWRVWGVDRHPGYRMLFVEREGHGRRNKDD